MLSSGNTFGAIADELVAKMEHERKAERTISKVTWLLGIARQDLGTRPVADITAAGGSQGSEGGGRARQP